MRTIALTFCMAGLAACATSPLPPPAPTPSPAPEEVRIRAVAVSRDGDTLWYAWGSARCEIRSLSIVAKSERPAFRLDFCPTKISPVDEQSLVLTDGMRRGAWKRLDGTDVVPGEVLAAASTSNFVEVRDSRLRWIREAEQRDLGAQGTLRSPSIVPGSGDLLVIARGSDGERITRLTQAGTSDASAAFASIDSFDVAPRGDEIVFSAARDGGFDVAISSPDGKTVNWIPPDGADEIGVTWAPRGNKVSYLIRRSDSTLVRSVHVPTAFQLTFETPFETVRSLAWEPRAERLVMILEGPSVSPHIDSIEYSGANRTALLDPGARLGREPERVAFGSEGAILLSPRTVRYGEKLPLFVLLTDEPLAWESATRDLDPLGGGILRVSPAGWRGGVPMAQFLSDLPWVADDSIVVIAAGAGNGAMPSVAKGQTLVTTGTKQPGERVFTENRLPSGGVSVSAETWAGAMQYLRERFQAKR